MAVFNTEMRADTFFGERGPAFQQCPVCVRRGKRIQSLAGLAWGKGRQAGLLCIKQRPE
jgi:hypothetical protein